MTAKKDSRLASKRRAMNEERAVARAVPLTYVLPDIASVLGQIQAIAGAELERMHQAQVEDPHSRLSLDDVKKLSGLTSAVTESSKTQKSLSDDDMQALTIDELRNLLQDEITAEASAAAKVIKDKP